MTAVLFQAGAFTALTQTLAWSVISFFPCTGASAAYLAFREILPIEVRANAIAVLFVIAQASALGPVISAALIGGGKNTTTLFIGYLLSAVIMVIGGIAAALLGVAAQGESLEAVASALATANRMLAASPTGPTTEEPIRGGVNRSPSRVPEDCESVPGVTELATALEDGPGWPDATGLTGPIAGVRVLDLSRVLAGPYAAMVLADLGADVVKVERPGAGDDTRHWGPPFHGDDAAYFFSVNRDRRSVTLDLTTVAGQAVVARLIRDADVVIENFLPRHLTALGLAALRDEASAVWVSVRGAGGDGPDGDKPGYDVMAQARSGLMSVTGTTEPTKVGVAVTDVIAGLYAALGAVAGLVARRSLRVEVGLLEVAVSALVNQASNALVGGVVPTWAGNDHPNLVPYGPVPCADTVLVLGAGNDAQFAGLCAAVGVDADPGWATNAGRVADRIAVGAALAAALGARTARQWVPLLEAAGVPCAPVQDVGQLRTDPQVVATGQLQAVEHPAGQVLLVGSPYRLDGVRPRIRLAPPLLGEHTAEVLAGMGLSDDQIEVVSGADRR